MISLDLFTAPHLQPVVMVRVSHLAALVAEVQALRAIAALAPPAVAHIEGQEALIVEAGIGAEGGATAFAKELAGALGCLDKIRECGDLALGIEANLDMLNEKGAQLQAVLDVAIAGSQEDFIAVASKIRAALEGT